jgi:2-dehydro-3-deoxyphosphogalactonate aldolase
MGANAMSPITQFEDAFARCPLVAILRGITPGQVEHVGEALVQAGFTLIEVPLNSPEPFESIGRLARVLEGRAVIGAGTVLHEDDVARVESAGGSMIIAPNFDAAVVRTAAARGLVSLPGIATPSEAFAALRAGATALKLFPAESSSPKALRAWRAVIPGAVKILPVGGITPDTIAPWRAAGASGFGLGSALYAAGSSAQDVSRNAASFVEALSS